jgi:transcriptional regulator with XRE-family HTH domain
VNIVGSSVKKIRQQKGWTQDQLTAKCNLVGLNISRGTLAKIESRVRRVVDSEVQLLAIALRVDIQQLFMDNDKKA